MSGIELQKDTSGSNLFLAYLSWFTFLGDRPVALKKLPLKLPRIFKILLLLVVFFVTIRFIAWFFIDDHLTLNQLGDFCRLYGGPRAQQYVCYSVQLSFSVAGTILPSYTLYLLSTVAGEQMMAKILEPLDLLSGHKAVASYLKAEDMIELRRQARLVAKIVRSSAIMSVLFYAPYVTYLYYSEQVRSKGSIGWYYTIFNAMCLIIWLYQCMGATGVSLGYFFITTKLMTFKALNFTERLIKEKQKVPSARKVMQLLSDHDEYLATLHTYNRYWSGYLAITLLELTPLLTTVAYMVFLVELNDKIFRLAFIKCFLEFIVLFTSVFMAGSRVSKAAHSCYPHMMGLISPRFDRRINTKILRSASVYETPIGFYCANLFVISYETYFSSVAEITSYFLLMVNVVQG